VKLAQQASGEATAESPPSPKLGSATTREPPPKLKPSSALGGLLVRREQWSLAPAGWLVLLLGLALSVGIVLWRLHPFLAVTNRTNSQFLVVEGWVPNYALEESITEFRTGHYRLMFTVGCDILNGVNVEAGDNHATFAVRRLSWLGMDPKLVQPVPSPTQYRDRTYASALALRQWMKLHRADVTSFNLVTVGVHARRSQLLFQKAFGEKVRVGIIAVADREYDPSRWWQYSEGVKEVISEGAGYFYARLFFHPAQAGQENLQPSLHKVSSL
jgi:hypothetical protein